MFVMPLTSGSRRFEQAGYSLVELMIAITLGLLILAGLVTIFSNNARTREEIDRAGQQIENGRYAMQVLSDDMRNSGYLAELDPRLLAVPGILPDPCATDVATVTGAVPLHIQGYADASSLTCISDVRPGTNVLVIRRASTCVDPASTTNAALATFPPARCNAEPARYYFQASLCGSNPGQELAVNPSDFALTTDKAALSNLASCKHRRDCTTCADIHQYRTHIYYVANNDNAGDGIPTLKRAELRPGAAGSGCSNGFCIVPIAEGVENIQFEYGIDSSPASSGDGIPDAFATTPLTPTDWANVVTVKMFVLARNLEPTGGHVDDKAYHFGTVSYGPYNDQFKRHAFVSSVRLNNPALRRAMQ